MKPKAPLWWLAILTVGMWLFIGLGLTVLFMGNVAWSVPFLIIAALLVAPLRRAVNSRASVTGQTGASNPDAI
jgi:hypothetical protein